MITGVIGALRVEIEGLCAKMENVVCEQISGVEFFQGTLCGKQVVVAQCGVGKVFAAICAQTMILRYGVDRIINTGIAGTLHEDLGILDLAVATAVVQHDMDTSPIGDPVGLLSGINVIELPTDQMLSKQIQETACQVGKHCVCGVIASGDQFIAANEQKERIRSQFHAIACEMEGAAIGHVCYVNRVPFAVIRSISDSASGDAQMEYPEMAQKAAAQAQELLLRVLSTHELSFFE